MSDSGLRGAQRRIDGMADGDLMDEMAAAAR